MDMQRQKERDKRNLVMNDVWLWQTQSPNVISSSSTVIFIPLLFKLNFFYQQNAYCRKQKSQFYTHSISYNRTWDNMRSENEKIMSLEILLR